MMDATSAALCASAKQRSAATTPRGRRKPRYGAGFPEMIPSSPLLQDGAPPASAPPAPGSGDVPAARHRRHAAHRGPHGESAHRVPGGAALDEGRLPGAGPGHLQAAGEVPQGGWTPVFVFLPDAPSIFPPHPRVLSVPRSSRRSAGPRASLRS